MLSIPLWKLFYNYREVVLEVGDKISNHHVTNFERDYETI